MDFSLTDYQRQLKATAHEFMEREVPKDRLLELGKSDTGHDPAIWKKAAEVGFLGALVPESHGGSGGSLLDAAMICEEFGRGPLPGPYFSSSVLGNLVLQECGADDQQAELLPRVASGEEVVVLALTESNYGWDADSIGLQAERQGDKFVLNGDKLFVHDALSATQFLCVARCASDPCKDDICVFVVGADADGVSRRSIAGFGGNVGEVKFDQVEVPAEARLAGSPDTWAGLERAILRAIPLLSAYKAGACAAVFDISVQYSRSRIAFGVPIGRFQRVQDHIIGAVNHLDAARWTTYEALWKLDYGRDARSSVHLAKAVTSEASLKVCAGGHEVHAGVGVMREYGLILHTQRSRTLYHCFGDARYHRRRLADALGW
jgi:alkylation response protein AidB-like acyl-CoA dehydrogenase